MSELQNRPPVEDWATDFDHFDPRFVADPVPVFDELRGRCPVAHSDRFGGLELLTRYRDVSEVAHDPARFTSRRIVVNEVPTTRRGLPLPPINYDPPQHTAFRRVVLPYFTPKAMLRWEEPIREICERQLDALAGRTECDIATEYAQAVPSELTALMLGVPVEDAPMFRRWIQQLLEIGPVDTTLLMETTTAMSDYLRDVMESRRDDRGEDVVSFILDQRDAGAEMTDDDVVNTLFLLLIAGIDTTWSAIGFSLLHLATHPEDRRRLAAEPDLVPQATEEFLRAYSPVTIARIATTDTEVGGCPVSAGDWVMMSFPAANRDPEVFDRADEVVIDRAENRHAAFGLGVHRCLGSNLARLEMVIAIEAWMKRFPEFHLTDPEAVSYSSGQVRGPRRIPVVLG
jgi:cytochrome P450